MTARLRRTTGYTVGITIFVNVDGKFGLWENGLRQNVIFLYRLFAAAPNCARVVLLNHGDADPTEVLDELGIPRDAVVRTPDVIDQLDYVVSVGAAIDPPTLGILRANGAKLILYKGGNGAVISMEALICQPPRGDAERYFDVGLFDEVWMTPQHLHTFKPWTQTLYRVPVIEVPQVWAPTFLDSRPVVAQGLFGYRPGKAKWRVGMMDPNITVMKTSHMGMLVAEAAFRLRPKIFAAIYISNALPHRDNSHFESFASSLTAIKAGIMTVEPRFVSADFLANHCDAIVTHHWENGLNYVYYDVLYGSYPLIHNSAFLKDYGYYYPDFAVDEGGRVLLEAFERHDKEFPAYQAKSRELIARLDPLNPANIDLHERLLVAPIRALA